MSDRVIVRDRATQDLRQQAEYLLQIGGTETAIRFLAAAEETFAQLAKLPGIGKISRLVDPRFGEVRQWRIKEFRDHLIFYRAQESTVEVLRVLHGARDLADVLSELDQDEE